jgi:hypothetical protein
MDLLLIRSGRKFFEVSLNINYLGAPSRFVRPMAQRYACLLKSDTKTVWRCARISRAENLGQTVPFGLDICVSPNFVLAFNPPGVQKDIQQKMRPTGDPPP